MSNKWLALPVGLAMGGVAYYARYVEPRWQRVRHVRLTLPRLGRAFDGYRIVQISDIHADSWMTRSLLHKAVRAINKRKPDLVVITGDFITRRVVYDVEELAGALAGLQAKDGVLTVPGNHDYFEDNQIEIIRGIIVRNGATDLSNGVFTIRRGAEQLHIAGIDNLIFHQARLDLVMEQLPEDGAAVLLAHEPDFADVVAPLGRFDLQLSGHTHGGQVRLPFIGAVVGPLHGNRYDAGLFDVNGMQLYVNRGLGTVSLPVRFRCRPEITVFKLRSSRR